MPKVIIPPPYRGPTQGTAELEVEGETVLACLEAVERRFPGFLPQVVSEEGEAHRFVKLFVDGEELQEEGLEAALLPDARVEVVAAIAGG
jgi:molybdopterin synthase sulfur carrier subunit